MYKIRLYVVRETDENTEDDEVEDDINLPKIMKRRNSRRPGTICLTVNRDKNELTKENDDLENFQGLNKNKSLRKNTGRTINAGNKRSVCPTRRSGRRKDQLLHSGKSPKIVRVKDQIERMKTDGIDAVQNVNTTNLVVFRSKNKLNGYRVSIFIYLFFF